MLYSAVCGSLAVTSLFYLFFDLQIKCTEMVRTEHISCCVEIKGEYLPPWIISNICANVVANGQNFEARFIDAKSLLFSSEPKTFSLC